MPLLSTALVVYINVLAAVLGLVMGSFLNCFAYRYAIGESVIKGRSKCALCGHALSAPELVPVFSWLFLRGKCRHCGSKISPRYVAAELLCAILYVSVTLTYGVSFDALKYLILVSLLFAAAATDLYCGLLPDRLVVIGTVTAFAFAFLSPDGVLRGLLYTAIGGLSVALPLLLFVMLFDKIMKRETMGGGDIKLMFMIGLFFDWKLNILIIILACVIGLIFALLTLKKSGGSETKAFVFGPSLAAAAWLVMLFGDRVVGWYLGLFAL